MLGVSRYADCTIATITRIRTPGSRGCKPSDLTTELDPYPHGGEELRS